MPITVTGFDQDFNIPKCVHVSQEKYPHISIAITDKADRTRLQEVIERRGVLLAQIKALKDEDDELKLEQQVLMEVYKPRLFQGKSLRVDKWVGALTTGTSPSSIVKDQLIAKGVALDVIAACTRPGKMWESATVTDATKPRGKYPGGDD